MFPEVPGARGGRPWSTACAGLLLCSGAVIPEIALAKETLTVDVSAGAEASTNPFLETGGSRGAIGGNAGIDAHYRVESQRTTLDLGAGANASTFFSGRGTDYSANGTANLKHQVSQTATIGVLGHYSYSRSSGRNYLLPVGNPTIFEPGAPETPAPAPPVVTSPLLGPGGLITPDVTLVGRRVAQQSFGGALNLDLRVSARTSLSLAAGADKVTYDDPVLSDYRMYNQAVSLTHRISEATQVIAQVKVAEVKYDNGEHDVIVTPLVGVSRRLSPRWDLSVYGGAAIIRSRLPDGTRLRASSLAASAVLCGKFEHSKLCFTAERQQLPSAVGGIRPVTSLRASYYDRLTEKDSVTLDASVERSERDTRKLFAPQTLAGASARYDHKLGDRLALFGTAQYIRLWQSGAPSRGDLRGIIGITLRLGDKG